MRLIKWTFALIIVGLSIFYASANFKGSLIWQHTYGIWDKLKDLLLVVFSCRFFYTTKATKYSIIGVLALRLIWEIVSWAFLISINDVKWVNILFIFTTACCSLIIIKELVSKWRQKQL